MSAVNKRRSKSKGNESIPSLTFFLHARIRCCRDKLSILLDMKLDLRLGNNILHEPYFLENFEILTAGHFEGPLWKQSRTDHLMLSAILWKLCALFGIYMES